MGHLLFENVSKTSGGRFWLSGFSLELDQKELLAIVGSAGCGKKTALRLLAGIEQVSTGRIFLDGKIINPSDERPEKIALLSGSPPLYPGLTVAQNLAIPLYHRRILENEQKVIIERTAKWLGITHLLKKKLRLISKLEKNWLLLAWRFYLNPITFYWMNNTCMADPENC